MHLMKSRKILQYIRKQRDQEIEEYRLLCSKIEADIPNYTEDAIKKRQSILTLEFPYKTDTVSVNQSLVTLIEMSESGNELKKTVRKYGTKADTSERLTNFYYNNKYQDNSFKNFLHSESIWPKVQVIKHNLQGKITISPAENVPEEDLAYALPREKLFKNIHEANLKDSSKRIYRCYARKHVKEADEVVGNTYIREGIDSYTLAAYFNYLEERCLKSTSLQPYKDLIEVRLLFYVPIKTNLLNQITLSDINVLSQQLHYTDNQYRFPSTFIELARSVFSKREPLLEKSTKKLDKFVSQTAARLKLNEKITPTLIRRSQGYIAQQEGYIIEKLPLR